jgi:hypothetical protein
VQHARLLESVSQYKFDKRRGHGVLVILDLYSLQQGVPNEVT